MKKIRVAILSSYSSRGGAAKATFRIYQQLRESAEIEPHFISFDTSSNFYFLFTWVNRFTRLSNRFMLKNKNDYLSYNLVGVYERRLLRKLENADVICLFWVNDSFLSLKTISKILSMGKPVIWRLSDCWPFTGGCHYSNNCELFRNDCKQCPYFVKPEIFDITGRVLKYKKNHWSVKKLTIACPSKWILNLSKNSQVFHQAEHVYLPTGTETNIYFPLDKMQARVSMNLPTDKFIIGVSADNLDDRRKGLDLFLEALTILSQLSPVTANQMHIVFIGKYSEPKSHFEFNSFGHISDPQKLNLLYNSFDLFVAPSREENLANTVLEAMSSAVPCLAFDIGGMKDLISNGETGYLIPAFDIKKMSEILIHACTVEGNLTELGKKARKKILNEYSIQTSVKNFSDIIIRKINQNS